MPPVVTAAIPALEPALPTPVGPVSAAVLDRIERHAPSRSFVPIDAPTQESDPFGLDLQLALYVCYELHYRGFAGVDATWEWDPGLLHLRGQLEQSFLDALREKLSDAPSSTAAEEMARLSLEPVDGTGPSYFLRDHGSWEQLREYFVHRSIYHLKEGDPHAWAIPRLTGTAKAAFVAVEFDEFGGGRGDRVHQHLFAELLTAASLDPTYLRYLDHVPAEALAAVNVMSMFGLRRDLRGATVGHFAATEITSSPGSRRLAQAMERMGAPRACSHFYLEHVEADAVHEQIVRADVVGDLVAREPHLDADVVFGIRAFEFVEDKLAAHLISAWGANRTSLRREVD